MHRGKRTAPGSLFCSLIMWVHQAWQCKPGHSGTTEPDHSVGGKKGLFGGNSKLLRLSLGGQRE